MGKSPAKWIKSIIFGKQDSKSRHLNGKTVSQFNNKCEKEGFCTASTEPSTSHSAINQSLKNEAKHAKLEDDANYERSATIVQTFFRGFLVQARRAFRAIKSVIRFQALVRGYLVRRQAVATLCSVYEIVKIQALFRKERAKNSPPFSSHCQGSRVSVRRQIAKLTSDVFVLKLLSRSSSTLHLRLCYDTLDPNSAPNWLSRWTDSRFWKPNPLQCNGTIEAGGSLPKRSVSKTTSGSEQSKRGALKASSVANGTPPESEFERVKRNLIKVQNLAAMAKGPVTQVEIEKPKMLEEDAKKENECLLGSLSTSELLRILEEDDDEKNEELKFSDEGYVEAPNPNGQKHLSDEQGTLEIKRKTSYNTEKHEPNDNELVGTPKLPSYMNATASAKAKLRAQSSPNSNQEASERSVVASRRQSPTSANRQISGTRINNTNGKSNSSSRNGKVEWRKW